MLDTQRSIYNSQETCRDRIFSTPLFIVRCSILLCFFIFATACTSAVSATPTSDLRLCANLTVREGALTDCLSISADATLLQTISNEQVILSGDGVTITLQGTLLTRRDPVDWRFIILEGTAIISAANSTRIAQPGFRVIVPLADGQANEAPSDLAPVNQPEVADLPIENLSREIILPENLLVQAATSPTPLPTLTTEDIIIATEAIPPTLDNGICVPTEEWTGRYFIQRGDNMTRIARRYGLTLQQLQEANCITNPNLVRAGQELRVPQTSEAPPVPTTADIPNDFRPTLVIFDTPTFTPSAIAFRADRPLLSTGECTTIRWDVQNIEAAFLEDEEVPISGAQEVCLTETTTYTLYILYYDDAETSRELTIVVDSPNS